MVVNRRKKVVKYRGRGSGTHGGGARKKRRGAGSRGGRGNAGTGKRAGQKKAGMAPSLGRYGFTSIPSIASPVKAINVGYFTLERVQKLLKAGKVSLQGDTFIVDLAELGYDKLLGAGSTKLKLKIAVARCSAQAEEKIKAAGGEIVKK